MQPIQVYQTDDQGLYVPSALPVFSDVLDGHHLIPHGCKTLQPPTLGERQAARSLGSGADAAWEIVPDWRGYVYYTADGDRHEIKEVGISPPAVHWDSPPPPTPQQLAIRRAWEIKAELQQIDADGARPAREIALALVAGGTPPQAAVSKVQALEAQAQALRTELATLSEVT